MSDKEEKVEVQKDVGEMKDARSEIAAKARDRRNKEIKAADETMSEQDQELISQLRSEASGEEVTTEEQDAAKMIKEGISESEKIEKEEKPEKKESLDTETVDVVIYGRTHKVPKKDVDRAGGVELYQKDRAANIRMQRAATREAELKRREHEIAEREKKLTQTSPPAADDPGSKPPEQGAHDGSDKREAKVSGIVEKMYSGSSEKAQEAIQEIMDANRPDLSAEAVADLVIQRLEARERTNQETTQEQQAKVSDIERAEVNRVMAGEYGDVLNDNDMKAIALSRFETQQKLPENLGRSLADIARDAGEYARTRLGMHKEVQRRDEEKAKLPRQPSAAGKEKPPEPEKVPTVQDHIKRLRQGAALDVKRA